MAKYRVSLEAVASTVIEVEAENKDDAYEAALGESMPRICAQCSGWGGRQNLEIGDEWDIPQDQSTDEAVEEITDADA